MRSPSPTLENDFVKLAPLTLSNYHLLSPIACQEKLVQYSPSDIASAGALKKYVEEAVEKEKSFAAMPFIIYDKKMATYAGSTRFMNIAYKNKVLEIGATWIGREFHGTGLNGQVKLLMLNYAFNEMHFEKVEFRIDERNVPSRKAVEKLGAKLEGILRKNVYLMDGYKRNTCCYGILKDEWN
ncbi:N-acetyltransferase [Arenibacter sp. TNZ]|jgi:RimJ/RimL family protein N-acetyltransferase|uniref:GNAT family N-acetyltransferase n=1 Tax=Arenibacter TaxID=178469 RepID=UPI000CD3AFE1|nr:MULTISPECIES: GNAT family protein [Arenibacter]MCM4171643.1 N-acetyltransferase [Arenibacter sp. TNZ]